MFLAFADSSFLLRFIAETMYRNDFDVECCIALYVSTPYNYNVNSKKTKSTLKQITRFWNFDFRSCKAFRLPTDPEIIMKRELFKFFIRLDFNSKGSLSFCFSDYFWTLLVYHDHYKFLVYLFPEIGNHYRSTWNNGYRLQLDKCHMWS